MTKKLVFFVGPLPPPVHGFSLINKRLTDRLSIRYDVVTFDRSSSGTNFLLARYMRFFGQFTYLPFYFTLKTLCRRPSSVYIGVSGSYGQLVDLLFIFVCRLLRVPTVLHHHSFRYLRSRSNLFALCLRFAYRARHVSLCARMSSRLQTIYGIRKASIVEVSNAAFQTFAQSEQSPARPRDDRVTIGFLSNITAEKGIYELLNVLSDLEIRDLPVRAVIAGPIEERIRADVMNRIRGIGNALYCGPLYDDDKVKFFNSLDIFMFPTRYKNEAEPVVVYEAFAAGSAVIASDIGCLPSMCSGHDCKSVRREDFHANAVCLVKKFVSYSIEDRVRIRSSVKLILRAKAAFAGAQFKQLMNSL